MPNAGQGWSDILGGSVDLAEDAERTDPSMTAPPLDDILPDDPVLAAMAELDGLGSIPSAALEASANTVRSPNPAEPAETAEAPAIREAPRLRLPTPAGGRDTAKTAEVPRADPIETGFSADALVEHLAPDEPATPAEPSAFWSTYRDVIIAAVGGTILVAAAIAYTTTKNSPKENVVDLVVMPTKAPAPPPPVPVAKVEEPKIAKVAPKVAATPMLTILSKPSGGLVEVNGVVYGKSPIVMPAPRDARQLEVVIKLDGHKRFVKQVIANDAGHYALTAQLEPQR